MNNCKNPHNDEKLVQQFLTNNAHKPHTNEWFTKRVINKLPTPKSNICMIIMSITTLIAVVACGALLYLSADYILPLKENNITVSLLSIYTAMISTVILVTLQVIRLIKTYF